MISATGPDVVGMKAPPRTLVRVLSGLLCSGTVALAITRVVLAAVDPQSSDAGRSPVGYHVPGGGVPVAVFEAVVLMMLALVALVLVSRRPENPVGWILQVIPFSLAVLILSAHAYWSLALHGHGNTHAAESIAWLASWVWIPAMIPLMTLFPLLFPTGRLLSSRWRPALISAFVSGVLSFVGEAFPTRRFEDYPVDNPYGIGPIAPIAGGVGFLLMAVGAITGVVCLVKRYRRSGGDEREQLKWVTTAAVVFVAIFAIPTEDLAGDDVGFATLLVGLLVICSAVAVAILRFRLYDIDVVINRALVYGTLTALLAGVYVGSVLLLELALRGLTEGSGLSVAASTLAVAALFGPLRRRIQHSVDRRFFRNRYDAARTIEAFGTRLRDQLDLDALDGELRTVVGRTMQPSSVSLWLRDRDAR